MPVDEMVDGRVTPSKREGLKIALAAVRLNAEVYKESGLSALSFWIGLMNIAFSAFLLGRAPNWCWVWQVVKCTALLVMAYRIKAGKSQQLYFLDMCWVFAALYSLLGAVTVFQIVYPSSEPVFEFPPSLRLASFGLANGPLGWACVALGNALVLHDAEQMSALFIHISPAFVTWSIQWHWAAVNVQWPGVFGPDHPEDVTFAAVFFPAFYCYLVWWCIYTAWMVVSGRFHSPSSTGLDTVYLSTLRTNAVARRTLGLSADDVNKTTKPTNILTVAAYMTIHLVLCSAAIAASYLLYHSFILHTMFCLGLFFVSSWNGAVRYNKMMTRYYEKRLEKLIKDD